VKPVGIKLYIGNGAVVMHFFVIWCSLVSYCLMFFDGVYLFVLFMCVCFFQGVHRTKQGRKERRWHPTSIIFEIGM